MELFFCDQRWTSEAEPELGVGIVTETSKGRVRIVFRYAGETRLYATESAPLRRVRFKPGDTVVDAENEPMLIEQVRENGNYLIYFGQDRILSEAELGNVSVKYGAVDRLLMGQVDTPQEFALRRRSLEFDHNRRISTVNGLLGGRIDLIPHQLYIAHEVSARYAPRVLLSDEVGLGKTIEACLILHRLLLSGRISRVLILVPESLIHQWFVEVLRRFNLWFHIFDEERCTAIENSAPEGNPFLDDQLILCSTSFLAKSKVRTDQALAASWDMLVVDEAHHLKWSHDHVGEEYKLVESLSKVADGLLLLTATPEQLGLESHFARLRLLDPDRYSNYDDFLNESKDHRGTADLVEKISAKQTLTKAEKGLLQSLFGKDRLVEFSEGKEGGRNKLITDLLDQYGPGRVVFRNTRSSMKGFPQRKSFLAPLQTPDGTLMNQVSTEFASDLKRPDRDFDQKKYHFENDLRVDWFINFMEEIHPAKALLICTSFGKVIGLEKELKERTNLKVSVFHEGLSLVQRDRNAAWFSEPEGARLLLCSEIGSEGRNFQFAHHLVLFDLPIHPELLEQRIGRLDRIGQTEDINIHVPYFTGSPQEAIVRWYQEGLNAFENQLEGGNQIWQLYGGRLLDIASQSHDPESETELNSLIEETKTFQMELKDILANGRDRLLEMNSFRPEVAGDLVEKIRRTDLDMGLEYFMLGIFSQYSIEVEDLAPRTYILQAPLGNAVAFPSIPDEGVTVTFDRKRALSREEISFLSWDHPMVTGAIDLVLGMGVGSSSFGILKGAGSHGVLLELLFVVEVVGENRISVDRFLPNTPLRVVVDHHGVDVTDQYPVSLFDQKLRWDSVEELLENEMLVEAIIPKMLDAGTKIAEGLGNSKIATGLARMKSTLNHEIERLMLLQKRNNHIRPVEIKIAKTTRENFNSLILNAGIRLDAVQLIQLK